MLRADQHLRRLLAWFSGLDRPRVVAVGMATMLVIVLVDLVTGWRLRFTMFYILPVWISAGRLGLRTGLGFALAGAVVGAVANAGVLAPLSLIHSPLWIWDLVARFVPLAIVAWLVDKQRVAIARERQLARTDGLTGTLNRRALLEEATRALAHGQRFGLATGFLYLDLDDFKSINDQHGHAAGDDLLIRVAATSERELRRGDLVARVGGDEFVLLLAATTPGGAEGAAQRVCSALRHALSASHPPASFSAGLCLVEPGATSDPAVALAEADRVLYAAKRSSDPERFRITRLSPPPIAPRAA